MLEKFLNKKVLICISHYAAAQEKIVMGPKAGLEPFQRNGIVTQINNDFIELDNNEVVAIKYITTIKYL